jgi:GH43 family beta-xylosidase
MTYSANHYADPDYGVGYATASAPLGMWTKSDKNPILRKNLEAGVSGPGHNSMIRSPDGREWFIVYHSHADPDQPSGRRILNIDRVIFNEDGTLEVIGPTRTPQPMPSDEAQ